MYVSFSHHQQQQMSWPKCGSHLYAKSLKANLVAYYRIFVYIIKFKSPSILITPMT